LVAGAWAAGLNAGAMRREMDTADWNDLFQDNPGYAEVNFRNKRLSQHYLPGSETRRDRRGSDRATGSGVGAKDQAVLQPAGARRPRRAPA
jgi:NTE family protein